MVSSLEPFSFDINLVSIFLESCFNSAYMIQNVHLGRLHTVSTGSLLRRDLGKTAFDIRIFGAVNQIMRVLATFLLFFSIPR